MRQIFAYAFLAAALLAGACQTSEPDRSEDRFGKPQEQTRPQARVPHPSQQAPANEQHRFPRAPTNAIETARSVKQAEAQLAAARADYKAEMSRQLERIDARIAELEAKGDETSRETAARLREHRDQFAARLERLDNEPPARWEHLKDETSDQMQQLQKEADEAR